MSGHMEGMRCEREEREAGLAARLQIAEHKLQLFASLSNRSESLGVKLGELQRAMSYEHIELRAQLTGERLLREEQCASGESGFQRCQERDEELQRANSVADASMKQDLVSLSCGVEDCIAGDAAAAKPCAGRGAT